MYQSNRKYFFHRSQFCNVFLPSNFTDIISHYSDNKLDTVCLPNNTFIRQKLSQGTPPDSVSHPSTEELIEKLWTLLCTVKSITLLSPPIPIQSRRLCVRVFLILVCVREYTSWWWVNCKWMKIQFIRHRTTRSRHKWVLRYTNESDMLWMCACFVECEQNGVLVNNVCVFMSSNANFPPYT